MAVGGGGGAEASSGGATTGSGGAMRVVAGMGLVALGLLGFTVLTVPHEDIEEPRPMKVNSMIRRTMIENYITD
jgi:phosphoribosylformylglycinamidine (FGAM) synthase-like enzyme